MSGKGNKARRWRMGALLFAVGGAAALLLAAFIWIALPLPLELLERDELSIKVVDRTGRTLRVLRSTEGLATPLPKGELPRPVVDAFIAAEDKRFGRHPGVDPLALMRAVRQNLTHGRIVSGGSTIAQQLARLLFPHERTFLGKAGEALWALRLTAHLSREELLRAWLDRVPLGRGAAGVETAAEIYFNRPAASLSLAQGALLAGLARSPATADPFRRAEAARARLGSVLSRMEALGFVSAEAAREARSAPLDLSAPTPRLLAPHFVTALAMSLKGRALSGASRIETTLDLELQSDLEQSVREVLSGLGALDVGQAAVLVIDNPTGEVLAYVGSADFFDDAKAGQNNGVRALRQPGSTLKPFAYGLALSRGWTAASLLSDVDSSFETPTGAYQPKNYDRRAHGPVRLRAALANSYNVPAVRLAEALGPEALLAELRLAGFASLTDSAFHYGVGLVLGNGDVSLWELARAYRGLALGGRLLPLVDVARAEDGAGRLLAVAPELAARRFLPEGATALLTDIISDERARAAAFGLDNALRFPFQVAAKTGTSRAHIDNWTVGFTRERTVAVWVGNFDGTPMNGVSGITGAGPLFRRAMLRAMRGVAPEPLDTSDRDRAVRFEERTICPLSGELAKPTCPSIMREKFLPGSAPKGECSMHRVVGEGEGSGKEGRVGLALTPELALWAEGRRLEVAEVRGSRARIAAPREGDEYLLDPGLPDGDQMIPVRAEAPAGAVSMELRTQDGARFTLAPPFAGRIPARPGAQRLELWLPGEEAPAAVVHFRVR